MTRSAQSMAQMANVLWSVLLTSSNISSSLRVIENFAFSISTPLKLIIAQTLKFLRLVYNDWGLNGFVQMLIYKCLRFGKELYIIDESDTTKMSTHLDPFRKADHHDTKFYS